MSAWTGLVLAILGATSACRSSSIATFETPEQAMQAVADIAGAGDESRVEQLFGPGSVELFRSGDEVADHEDGMRVKEQIRQRVAFQEASAGTKVALLGDDGWPFPIPLVLTDGRWRFDIEAGREELDSRRIGRNELSTIATLHEFVEAQREYHGASRDGNPPTYARMLISSEGKHDGLYWPVEPGEPESPLGPLVAAAAAEGYHQKESGPTPFHGYLYRALTGQGPSAPGGEKSYLDERGLLTRGFALLAWPAKYGVSGVMTFQVNQQGIVYQRDLGPDTDATVAHLTVYAPDESWDPTGD